MGACPPLTMVSSRNLDPVPNSRVGCLQHLTAYRIPFTNFIVSTTSPITIAPMVMEIPQPNT
jgi:hypothetical protein